jgi:signal transduction histidine kinase
MLQIKRVLLAFSASIIGPFLVFAILYPHDSTMKGQQFQITSGSLAMEPCQANFKPVPKKHVTLPYRQDVFEDGLKCYRFETELPDINRIPVDHAIKLMIGVLGRAYEVSLNGHVLDRYTASDEHYKINRLQPYSIVLYDSLLRSGTNNLTIRYATRDMVVAVSQISIGSQEVIDNDVRFYEFFSTTVIKSMTFLLVLMGIFLFWFNSVFPNERLLGLSGRIMLLTATLMSVQMMAEIPAEFYSLWRGVVVGLIGLLVSGAVEFLREYSGQRVLGNEQKIVLGYVVCLSLVAFVFNDAMASKVSMLGVAFLLTYCFTSLMWMLLRGSLLQSKIGMLYFACFMITDTLFLRDFMVLPGNASMFDSAKRLVSIPPFLQEEIFFSPSALMLLLFSMMAVVIQRYQAAREYEEAEAVRIYGALAQSEAELRTVLGQQHAVESAQVVQSERQRLLLEIHDGIGAQLADGYRRASEGKLTSGQFADVFQYCIDDMRLIMDCISMRPRAEMEVILGSLLHRLQPRLAKSGIGVDYRPFKRQQSHLGLSDVQCLHAGRIVQECLIAALQHQACNRVVLVLRESARGIFIYAHDNGAAYAGQDGEARRAQQAELRKRAASLGSTIRFHHGDHGHATALLYRFGK